MAKKYCMPRNILLVFLLLQLISTIERQIFDFLGYMWIPILGNFFNIIFVIFGLFGLYQYRSNYMLAYAVWTLFWIGLNIFIVCFYLEVGDLNNEEDILSFGTGSFSWWLVNSPGCQPHYNTTVTEDFNPLHPMRPSYVEGCYMSYEDVEVTHAAIQLVISVVGLVMAAYMSHYYITVINPKREKQGVKAMYSIEYSPHRESSNPNTLERETDLHELENGEARPHMTPRRVKRRSYRNSARNSSKSMSRHQQRQSSKSARSSGRSHKSINPVTRLIDADQNRADSSTSNEAERYGQINPGFQADQSRPNSIYNLSGPPTDIEASRPQSALTSYSNFHGQRRLPATSQPSRTLPAGVTNLTQESLMNHESNMNSSYDDLPPPPPPISSSPTPPDIDQVSDSDNTSSVATAQIPVPQQRSSIRRNEYVNIPVPPQDPSPVPAIISHQEPEPQSPGPKPTHLPHPTMAPPPIPPHNYANVPAVTSTPQHQFNGARPRTTNPLYNKKEEFTNNKNYNDYTEVERSQTRQENQIVPEYESRVSYEAETLRADTKLTMPPSYYHHDPYSLSDNPSSQRSSQSEPYPQHPDRTDTRLLSHNVPSAHQGGYNEQPSHSQHNQRPYQQVPQSPRDSQSDSQSVDNRYAQLEDFSNSQRDNRLQQPNVNDRYYQDKPMHPNQNLHNGQITNGYPEDRAKSRTGLTNDTDSGLHSMGSDFNSQPSQDQRAGEPAMKRVPTGHQARDRASLRLKQRREMEAKSTKQNKPQQGMHNGHNDHHGYANTPTQSKPHEEEYGFAGATVNGKPNGYADMSGKKTPDDIDDKWYLKDSMRPVGASTHGQNCKCYRCQRKLTAI